MKLAASEEAAAFDFIHLIGVLFLATKALYRG
jgi:hypothetical protein